MNPVIAAIIGAIFGGFLVSGGNEETEQYPEPGTPLDEQ